MSGSISTAMILPIFHLAVVLINGYALYYDQNYMDFSFPKALADLEFAFKNRSLFLTMWCLVLQTVYFTISFLNDIFDTNDRSPRKTNPLRVIKDSLFSVAFPLALYVSFCFWGMYALGGDLVLPDHMRKVWLSQVEHTTIVVFICLELYLSPRNYPSRAVGMSISVIFIGCYLSYLYKAYLTTGTWVYPVLDMLPWHLRLMVFTFCTVFMYILGEKINEYFSPSTLSKYDHSPCNTSTLKSM